MLQTAQLLCFYVWIKYPTENARVSAALECLQLQLFKGASGSSGVLGFWEFWEFWE